MGRGKKYQTVEESRLCLDESIGSGRKGSLMFLMRILSLV